MNQVDWQAGRYYLLSLALYHATLATLFDDQLQTPGAVGGGFYQTVSGYCSMAKEIERAEMLLALSELTQ